MGKKYLIAQRFGKEDDTCGLHRTGVGVYLNELECGDPSRRDPVHNF